MTQASIWKLKIWLCWTRYSPKVRSAGASTGVTELNKMQGWHQPVVFSILLLVLQKKKKNLRGRERERECVCVLDREGNRVFANRTGSSAKLVCTSKYPS